MALRHVPQQGRSVLISQVESTMGEGGTWLHMRHRIDVRLTSNLRQAAQLLPIRMARSSHSTLQLAVPRLPLILSAVLLAGCAELVVHGAALAVDPNAYYGPRNPETNREIFNHPVALVWDALVQTAERDGRTIVARDVEKFQLRLSYPFSLLQWGGVVTVTCESVTPEDGRSQTIVHVVRGSQDPVHRVRLVGDAILKNVHEQLEREAAPRH